MSADRHGSRLAPYDPWEAVAEARVPAYGCCPGAASRRSEGMTMPSAAVWPSLSGRTVPAVAAACWLAASACPCVAAEPLGRGLEATCRLTETTGCRCSFATVETVLSFAEAADLLLGYYQTIPNVRYAFLLDRLLRQCAGEATYPEADTPDGLPASAGPSPARTAWRP